MIQYGLIHLANAIYLVSYAVKDLRTLRWLTMLGICLLIPYYLWWGMYAAAGWNAVFFVINLVRLRPIHVRDSAFPVVDHRPLAECPGMVRPRHIHFGEIFCPDTCPVCKTQAKSTSGNG